MDLQPEQAAALLAAAAFGPKLVTWLGARFVSKADDAEKRATNERDEREKAMAKKLEEIATSINDLKSDAREDRSRAAQLQGAVDKIEERIDGVSNNHRPRIELLEQKVAVLEAKAPKARTR